MLREFLADIFHTDQHKLFSVAGYNEAQASACILILRVFSPNISLLQLTTTCGLDSRHQGESLASVASFVLISFSSGNMTSWRMYF